MRSGDGCLRIMLQGEMKMPVKTLAMKRLKGSKRTFYMDEHGGYSHKYVDFYPAELVERIIEE